MYINYIMAQKRKPVSQPGNQPRNPGSAEFDASRIARVSWIEEFIGITAIVDVEQTERVLERVAFGTMFNVFPGL
jgi:hypothetical protein